MTAEELREATRQFDRELIPDDFHPLGPEKSAIWERLRSEHSAGEKETNTDGKR
jgi:hypothetical protein